jgi:hypothetical protein
MRWPWERLAALGGIVAVALWLIGIAILESTDAPDDDDPEGILRWYQDEANTILAGGFIFELGALVFIVFLAALLSRLWWTEGGTGFLTIVAFAGGLGTALFTLGIPAADMGGALSEEDLTPEAAQTLNLIDNVFFIGAELTAALFVAAVGFHTLRARGLPVWLGWISLVLALWLLIPPIGWAGLIFGMPLWTLIVAVLLYIKPLPPPGPPPITSQFIGTDLGGPEAPPPITSQFVE